MLNKSQMEQFLGSSSKKEGTLCLDNNQYGVIYFLFVLFEIDYYQ
jgi:hypothetical protein